MIEFKRHLKNVKKSIFLASIFAGFSGIYLYPETFRVAKTNVINLVSKNSTENTNSIQIGINEGLCIKLSEDSDFMEFVQGIEIKMQIPEIIASWKDSVACTLYRTISPSPNSKRIDYSGTRGYVSTLPARLSWILQIPLVKQNSFKNDRYVSTAEEIPDTSNNCVFIRLQPVIKGIPEEILNAKITISVKPVLFDKGRLKLSIFPPEKESDSQNNLQQNELKNDENIQNQNDDFNVLKPFSVYIDDLPYDFSDKDSVILETGIHDISVISEFYRSEVRTLRIDQAKTTELLLTMKSINPTLLVTAPEGSEITVDEKPFFNVNQEVEISEGNHVIKFKIGGYEIVRTISAIKGKTYKADFTVDLKLSEE